MTLPRNGLIGRPLTRREDIPMVRGRGAYVDDLDRPGLGHVVFVRSPHAHAALTAIRAPAAAPGLIAVVTAAELAGRVEPFPVLSPPGVQLADEPHPLLAAGEVRYVGQPVAAVVATSRALAADAVEQVEVDYEPRPAVLDPHASDLALTRWSRATGDVDGAFAAAAHVVRGRYGLPRLVAAPIEPRGAMAEHDPGSDLLTVWCSAQDTHRPLEQLTHILRREPDRVRVVVPDVGGAFGSKGVIAAEVAVIARVAIDLGRPLKWVEDRTENFLGAYQGRGITGELELALDAEARMRGIRAHLTADLGAYLFTTTPMPPHTAGMLITGCYDIPAASVTVAGMRTNKVPTGPYRGAGRPEAAYLLERLVDDAARQLELDRIELRRRNLIRTFPHETAMGFSYDSGDYPGCLDAALALTRDLDAAPAPPGRVRGSGVGVFVERAGGQWESAAVTVGREGRVLIRSSASPHGQGHDTTFAQIAADRLGIGLDRIALRFGDSAEVPPGTGTFGSRSTAVAGSAIVLALDAMLERGRALVAAADGREPAEVPYALGRFDGTLTLAEVARLAPEGVLAGEARFDSELVFSSGAYAAVVEIERDTGRLEVLRLGAVDDAGTVINPLLAHGQVLGGAVQGLGECLTEVAVYDEDGQLRTASFMDYGLPSAPEVPPIAMASVVSPTPRNPLGAKGVGEGGAIGTLAAVANAVADALGGRHVDPPFTPETLWRMLL